MTSSWNTGCALCEACQEAGVWRRTEKCGREGCGEAAPPRSVPLWKGASRAPRQRLNPHPALMDTHGPATPEPALLEPPNFNLRPPNQSRQRPHPRNHTVQATDAWTPSRAGRRPLLSPPRCDHQPAAASAPGALQGCSEHVGREARGVCPWTGRVSKESGSSRPDREPGRQE